MYAPTLGCLAKPASVRSSWLWSGPSYCMAQPALCVMAHDAIDVGILLQQVGAAEALGDVLAGAGRAVDGADDGDVVARAVAQVSGRSGRGRSP